MACKNCGVISIFTCGGLSIIASIVILILWPSIFLSILSSQLVLTNTSKSYELWQETPIPMYLELFLYNFTNYEAVSKDPNNIKPHFVEMGPYVFREHHIKVNETWNDNATITFLQRRIWWYEPDMSNGSLSDEVTNINTVAITAGHYVRNLPLAVKLAVNQFLKSTGEGLVVTKTAGELLFEGYSDKIIDIVNEMGLPIHIPFDKFGWFYDRNLSDTYDGVISMFTGADDINKLGLMDLWNYKDRVDFYDGKCGQVSGSTGELFPPKYQPDYVSVFATDVCSEITLKLSGDITVEGISGSLFTGDDSVFDNGSKYPAQSCFCHDQSLCPMSGGRDVSKCKLGAPAVVTFPHFYLTDPYYVSKIDGVTPNKENDEFRMGLEVFTGIPLLVRAQLQINLFVQRNGMSFYNKLPDETYFPMLWFRQEVKLTDEFASDAKLALLIPQIVEGIMYAILVIGALLISIGVFKVIKKVRQPTDSAVLINNDETS